MRIIVPHWYNPGQFFCRCWRVLMANIAFISICDRNAHGLRMMSANLRRLGHQCSIVFLKRYGRSDSVDAEPDDYPWIGIDSRGREFRYAHGSPITDRELELLRRVVERI